MTGHWYGCSTVCVVVLLYSVYLRVAIGGDGSAFALSKSQPIDMFGPL
jgi:hypothetical protein